MAIEAAGLDHTLHLHHCMHCCATAALPGSLECSQVPAGWRCCIRAPARRLAAAAGIEAEQGWEPARPQGRHAEVRHAPEHLAAPRADLDVQAACVVFRQSKTVSAASLKS